MVISNFGINVVEWIQQKKQIKGEIDQNIGGETWVEYEWSMQKYGWNMCEMWIEN